MKHDSVNDLVVSMYSGPIEIIKEKLAQYEPVITGTSGSSVHIQFRNLPKGLTHKLRVSDHVDRTEHPFKWQLTPGIATPRSMQKPFVRYYGDPLAFTNAFTSYYDVVAQGD